ncbi:molybdopterin-guanine dinucleotide biosynthesis protein B [Thiocapsa imhoffii]|uniref:Molybdopterin-guanine dinucleotide biosynthesis protein B n=1 Tax=Thiocapsa imhoffii TaxID=382777 RepID=A0A9X1B8R1_9GAMM|nr:molybdopterin-guanine dinucleotide biosynthesis protein B [Thiocapsa imhoffii]MBK1644508.1 molybdopterin-guanine dinucleotide biosynthesis protein B [Thiocapsa imhoffii]
MRHDSVPVVGFVAPSGMGKTTLVRAVVHILTVQGLAVGYLKHAHHRFDLDTPGKDSYEVRAAGASQVLLASGARWALQVEHPVPTQEPALQAMLSRFEHARLDLIIVEGFKHAAYPKIEVYRSAVAHANQLRPLYPCDPDIIAVATDAPLPEPRPPVTLPLNDAGRVAEFVRGRCADARDPGTSVS